MSRYNADFKVNIYPVANNHPSIDTNLSTNKNNFGTKDSNMG